MLNSLFARSLGLESSARMCESICAVRPLYFNRNIQYETVCLVSKGISTMALDGVQERYLLVGDYRGDIRIFDTTPSVSSGDGGIGAGDGGPGTKKKSQRKIKGGAEQLAATGAKRYHRGCVSALAWYPVDCGMFVSAGWEGKLCAWDTETLTPVETLQPFAKPEDEECVGTDGNMHDIAMPPHGTTHCLVALAGNDNRVVLYDMGTGGTSHTLRGHVGDVTAVAWDPGNEYLLVSGSMDGAAKVWDVRKSGDTACLRTLDALTTGPSSSSSATRRMKVTTLSDDGVATTSSVTAHSGAVRTLHFIAGSNGALLASTGADGKLLLWDMRRHCLKLTNFKKVSSIAKGTAGLASIATGVSVPTTNQFSLFQPSLKSVHVVDGTNGAMVCKLDAHFDSVSCCVVNHDTNQHLYSGGMDGSVLRWKPDFPAKVPVDVDESLLQAQHGEATGVGEGVGSEDQPTGLRPGIDWGDDDSDDVM